MGRRNPKMESRPKGNNPNNPNSPDNPDSSYDNPDSRDSRDNSVVIYDGMWVCIQVKQVNQKAMLDEALSMVYIHPRETETDRTSDDNPDNPNNRYVLGLYLMCMYVCMYVCE